jgi:metallopeptidase MepB
VSTDAGLREAPKEATKMINNFRIELSMREDIYKLAEAVSRKRRVS